MGRGTVPARVVPPAGLTSTAWRQPTNLGNISGRRFQAARAPQLRAGRDRRLDSPARACQRSLGESAGVNVVLKPFKGSGQTQQKLDCLREYLQAFSIALQNKRFLRIYIDAFAGTGHLTEERAALPLFDGDAAHPQYVHTPGSARIAAAVDPPFHTLVLVEQDPARFAELERIQADFPDRKFALHKGDANDAVTRICRGVKWHTPISGHAGFRGVVFLDPFGMEVDWSTVEAIARTEALDCWYFFPLSGLYRNAPRSKPSLTADKRTNIDRVLGTTEWYDRWYGPPPDRGLFESEAEATRKADVNAIEAYVKERLETIFKGGVESPLRLHHDSGAPMASLFFAVANPTKAASDLARRIASHILRAGKSSQVRPR